MEYIIPVLVFLFGTIIGSFLNVVIFRHNSGRGFGGRSGCLTCARNLEWYELVPMFSFLFQRGKCRTCRTEISALYPLIEFASGLVFLFLFARFSFFLPNAFGEFMYFILFYGLVFSIMLVITGYDFRHKIIPDNLVYPLIIIAFLGLFFSEYGTFHFHPATLESVFAGVLVALPLFILWAISRGAWLGFGDVKLAVAMGLLLGAARGFAALMLGFWIGAVIGILILLIEGEKARKREIPFAPFLILGTLIAFFFDVSFMKLISIFAN